jgi:hypothetical protein
MQTTIERDTIRTITKHHPLKTLQQSVVQFPRDAGASADPCLLPHSTFAPSSKESLWDTKDSLPDTIGAFPQ